jgi:hypothetical protein
MCYLRNRSRASALLVLARRPDASRVLLKVWLDRPRILPLRLRATESPFELVEMVPTMRFCPSRKVKIFMSCLSGFDPCVGVAYLHAVIAAILFLIFG